MRLTSSAGRSRIRFVLVIAAALLAATGTPLLAGAAVADPAPHDPGGVSGPAGGAGLALPVVDAFAAALTSRSPVADVLGALDSLPATPNTSWGADPATGKVVLTVSDAAPRAGVDRLLGAARGYGDRVRVVHTTRPITEQLLGGDEINDGSIVCSAGFNVTRGGRSYLLTAGHCTAGLPDWIGVGPSTASNFPGTDYGVILEQSGAEPAGVDLYTGSLQPISTVGTPATGERVCASGLATKVTCGHVLAVDQTVDYGDGNVVHGLIKTDVHTDHGDSGGPLFDGAVGLGTVSGGDGVTDFFQPLAPILAAEGLGLA